MRKISITILVLIYLSFINLSYCSAESLAENFVDIVNTLEIYAYENGINLETDEDIKDVVSLGYLNAIKRLGVPFGNIDERIKKETIDWLAILCWLPIIPPEKKEESSKELKKIRKALAQNTYDRTLASISLLPGFAVSCIGEITPPNTMMQYLPHSTGRMRAYDYVSQSKFSAQIIESLLQNTIKYEDLFIREWTEQFIK